ncbi:MAG: iron chelate uptake ABC transporter family permease subunit [Propioniciclava sp.]
MADPTIPTLDRSERPRHAEPARRTPAINGASSRTLPIAHPTPPHLALPEPVATRHTSSRDSGPLPTRRSQRRYQTVVGILLGLAVLFSVGVLAWDNPMPLGSEGFWTIARLRATSLAVIAVVAFCQALATVAFQSVTNNRIITPGIMGFESLYRVIHTVVIFGLGVAGATIVQGAGAFLLQVAAMMAFAALLYGWLLSGRYGNLQVMLLVGIILGAGLGTFATLLQRMLSPDEFDVLTARMVGSIANADPSYLPWAVPLVAAAGAVLWWRAPNLNVMALGKDTAVNLGVAHRRETMIVLLLVSVLMATSTALVGPMTFLGFLVAMIAYQLADTHDHRHLLPVAWLTGFVVLAGAYFTLKHLFYAAGSVSVIIEVVGGGFFLLYVLRKGRL